MSFSKQSANTYRFECMVNGKRFYKTYKTFNESKKEVANKFLEWKVSCNNCVMPKRSYAFKEFAYLWLNDYCKDYSPIVIKNYRCNLKNWILPLLGHYKIQEITPLILDDFISQLKSSNNLINGQAKLSNGSISKIYSITRAIISTAYQKDLISQNPCTRVKLEFKKDYIEKTLHTYDIDTYRAVMELLRHDSSDYARVVEFAVLTGLRRSEIFGLSWDDVRGNQLSVKKTSQKVNGFMMILPTKNRSSMRTISLSKSTVELLNRYRLSHPDNTYIFQNVDYDSVTAWFRKFQRDNNIPRIRFHDLRHTHASLLLYKNIDIKTISERLGHSNIGITMNTYTHVLKELDEKAAVAIDSI